LISKRVLEVRESLFMRVRGGILTDFSPCSKVKESLFMRVRAMRPIEDNFK
jgi:hypothetical protein